jgi:hypothetical protein
MSDDLAETLVGLSEGGQFVTLTRRFQGEPEHRGFVLRVGKELILLHQFHDFCSEGLTALRIGDIVSAKSGKSERLSGEIIRNEKVSNTFDTPYDLADMPALLECLRAEKGICIVECESEVWSEEDEFFIGDVVSVAQGIVRMLCFDSLGRWEKVPMEIEIDAVTKCQMKTPYIDAFSRYLSAQKQSHRHAGPPKS